MFEILSSLIACAYDIFMLSETELDDTFTSAQCSIKWFFVSHRIERYDKGGGILITPHRHINRTSFEKVSSFVKYWDNVFCIKSKKQKMALFL